MRSRHPWIVSLLLLSICVAVSVATAKKKGLPVTGEMDPRKRVVHALNRLTFGPRPGDVDRVMAMGLEAWVDEQLHPEKINDSGLESRLAPLRTLRMETRELVENFPPPQLIRAVMNGTASVPSDPAKRAIYESQIARLKQKKGQKTADIEPAPPEANLVAEVSLRREQRLEARRTTQELLSLPANERMKQILRMSPEELRAFAASLKGEARDEFVADMTQQQRETILALNNPQSVVENELREGKVLRAVYSQRQLHEVMTDFWFNHFNVYINKSEERYLLTAYERDAIRAHALGKFEDLLVTTAKSPAMLFYLDNWLSVGPNSDVANGVRRDAKRKDKAKDLPVKQAKGKRNGLNENYGRELMELHTLGVNGGYTQKDVTEVARVFTGWTLTKAADGREFTFDPRRHEPGEKTVMGKRIKENGEKEGLEVLHILAHHPSTAKFVCTKLAMRFVADDPPLTLVDAMTRTFLKKDGDIREVMKTMLRSDEFWSDTSYRAKVKTPLEFVASALRATGAEVTETSTLQQQLQGMGMPLYGMQPPTGYSMKSEAWVNSAALLGRMNFALALTADRLKGTAVRPDELVGVNGSSNDGSAMLAFLESSLLAGDVSPQTHATLTQRLQDPAITGRKLDDPERPPNSTAIAGLILGSPEFQRR